MKKLQISLIVILSIIIVCAGVLWKGQSNIKTQLSQEKDKLPKVEKKAFSKKVDQEETKAYEKLTKEKLDAFLKHKYKDDKEDDDGSAYNVMKGLFAIQSNKIVLSEKSDESDYIKYYSPFDYKIKNFSATKQGNETEVVFNIEVTYKGKKVNKDNDLVKFNYDSDDKLYGGELYAK